MGIFLKFLYSIIRPYERKNGHVREHYRTKNSINPFLKKIAKKWRPLNKK